MATEPSPVTVTVPAAPTSARVLRAVAGSVAAGMDFTYDEIDDLRLALDEAFSHLLSAVSGADHVHVVLVTRNGALEVTVSCDGDAAAWPPAGARGELAWQVLSALADDAAFEPGPAIRFSKHPSAR